MTLAAQKTPYVSQSQQMILAAQMMPGVLIKEIYLIQASLERTDSGSSICSM